MTHLLKSHLMSLWVDFLIPQPDIHRPVILPQPTYLYFLLSFKLNCLCPQNISFVSTQQLLFLLFLHNSLSLSHFCILSFYLSFEAELRCQKLNSNTTIQFFPCLSCLPSYELVLSLPPGTLSAHLQRLSMSFSRADYGWPALGILSEFPRLATVPWGR